MRKLFAAAVFVTILAATAVLGNAQTETILHNFTGTPDGNSPSGGLIQATDGNFYGGTTMGGTDNDGFLYGVNSTGSTYTSLYSFTNGTDTEQPARQLLQGSDGNLYGVTGFTAFKVTTGGVLTTLGEPGGNPTAIIPASDGNYYFASSFGAGIFKITASTGAVTQIGTAPGFNLYGLVQASDGNLYGTELGGGTGGDSVIFKCTLSGTVTAFYTFPSTLYPTGPLVEGSDGQLYGVAADNTQATAGQIFKLNLTTAAYTNVATIPNSDGIQTPGQLILASDGNFYAVAQGNGDATSLVKITPGGTVTQPLSISNAGGVNSPLVQGSDGALYGTGTSGGSSSDGAVFKIVFSPALSAPITLALGKTSIVQDTSTTLAWSVSGAYSDSAGYCFATSTDPEWSGVKAASGEITLTPATVGSFTYALTCGGTLSNSVTLTVTSNGKVNTTTTLTASPNPVTIGATETFTATVKQATGATVPGGTVTFVADGQTLGTGTLNGSGTASFGGPTTGFPAGTFPVTATYNGNTGFNGSTSSAVELTLTTQIATSVTVKVTPSSEVEGGSVTISATVKPASGSGTPSGSVTFTAGSLALGTYTLTNGTVQINGSTSGIAEGTYTVTAQYGGSSSYLGSSGTANVVIQWPTKTTVTANPNPVVQGGTVTLTATVARTGSSVAPGGTVTFSSDGQTLGSATLSGGSASITQSTGTLPQGTYPVVGVYSGDTNDGASTSTAYDVTVD